MLPLSRPTPGGAAEVSELPTRGAQHLTRNMPPTAFVCAARPTFLRVSPEINMPVRLIMLTDGPTLEELNRSETFSSTTVTPTVE